MADTFHLPRIGDAMVEGEIVEWLVAVGDTVTLDQAICSIETDKSVVELTTPYRGTVLRLGGEIGDVIQVGEPLIVVGSAAEIVEVAESPLPPPTTSNPSSPPSSAGGVASPVLRRLAVDEGVDLATISGSGPGGRITRDDVLAAGSNGATNRSVLAMPKVRKAARDRSIELADIRGTGPGGVVTIDDLDRAGGAGPVPPVSGRRKRMSATRRAIARHLTESARTIPQFTAMVEVDAAAIIATRAALAERLEMPLALDALVMSLMIPVLRDHPVANAMVDGDDVVYHDRYDIGVAVDTPDGLMLPVVRNADRRSITELSAEIARLANAARERSLDPADAVGATCTVNNVGAVGIVAGTPILPLGTSAIVAFGRTRPQVQFRNGHAVEVPTMTISATFDHRLVDGGDAGRFLEQLRRHLEVPALGPLIDRRAGQE